jgi:hypothetical protein
MSWSKLIPALIYLGAVFLFLWASTQFKPGWARRGIALWWGARINTLLFLFVVFVVLLVVAFSTSR